MTFIQAAELSERSSPWLQLSAIDINSNLRGTTHIIIALAVTMPLTNASDLTL